MGGGQHKCCSDDAVRLQREMERRRFFLFLHNEGRQKWRGRLERRRRWRDGGTLSETNTSLMELFPVFFFCFFFVPLFWLTLIHSRAVEFLESEQEWN